MILQFLPPLFILVFPSHVGSKAVTVCVGLEFGAVIQH